MALSQPNRYAVPPCDHDAGLSSCAFFWQLSDQVSRPLSIHEALERTVAPGVDLFQLCDYEPLER